MHLIAYAYAFISGTLLLLALLLVLCGPWFGRKADEMRSQLDRIRREQGWVRLAAGSGGRISQLGSSPKI